MAYARARAPPGVRGPVHATTTKGRAEGVVAIEGRSRCSRRLIESAEVDMLIKLVLRVVVALVALAVLAPAASAAAAPSTPGPSGSLTTPSQSLLQSPV